MRIRDWSSDVCSSDLRLCQKQSGPAGLGQCHGSRHKPVRHWPDNRAGHLRMDQRYGWILVFRLSHLCSDVAIGWRACIDAETSDLRPTKPEMPDITLSFA